MHTSTGCQTGPGEVMDGSSANINQSQRNTFNSLICDNKCLYTSAGQNFPADIFIQQFWTCILVIMMSACIVLTFAD